MPRDPVQEDVHDQGELVGHQHELCVGLVVGGGLDQELARGDEALGFLL
jgi:hypothetical protein